MKQVLIIFSILLSLCCFGQSITSAEYFFDEDNGIGNGVLLIADSNSGQLEQTFSIPTTNLTDGFHSLYVRTLNTDNNWSLYDRQSFYLKNFTSTNITNAEYFFGPNDDLGIGNGTPLPVDTNTGQLTQLFTIPTSELSEGFHNFYLRTKNNDNTWSLYDRQIIYIKDFDFSPDEVTAAEYFIDQDTGVGTGTAIVFGDASQTSQILNIDSTNLAEGDHIFYVRVQDANGDWSIYDTALFTIDSSLGLKDSLFKSLKIYPNPFQNELSIKFSKATEVRKIEIYNSIGQIVYLSFDDKTNLQLSNLKSGIYILNLKTAIGNASFKIIKK